VPPERKADVAQALASSGARVLDCTIDDEGVRVSRS